MTMFRPYYLVLPLVFAGCGDTEHAAPDPGNEADRARVTAVAAVTETFRHREPAPGLVRSADTAAISAEIQGVISEILAAPGQAVRSGEPLVRIRSEEHLARVRRAEAELTIARTELERMRNLVETRAATRQELDGAQARHDSATASLAEAQTFLAHTEIRAPFDGLITHRHLEPGDLASPGRPVLSMAGPDRYRAEVSVPESLATGIRIGDILAYELDTPRRRGEAPVVEIAPASDPQTRTVPVKLALAPSPDLQNGRFIRVYIPGEERTRLLVPETACIRRGQLEYVFTIDNNRTRLTLVRPGATKDGMVEILSGLREGETIVSEPPGHLRDGQPVELIP